MEFAHTVANILRGSAVPMRAMIRATLPAHAAANFTSAAAKSRPVPEAPSSIASRMARL